MAPAEPSDRTASPRGERAPTRGHLALLTQPPDSPPVDARPYETDADRILAESRRYRLAVTREARRRVEPPHRDNGEPR